MFGNENDPWGVNDEIAGLLPPDSRPRAGAGGSPDGIGELEDAGAPGLGILGGGGRTAEEVAATEDGPVRHEGPDLRSPMMPVYVRPPMPDLSGRVLAFEPRDVGVNAAARSAGLTLLSAAAGFGIGLAAGGPWGAFAGLSFSSAFWNGYRAQKWWDSKNPSERHEAVSGAVMTAVALAAGGYSAYKAVQARKGRTTT
jgi:hypothetical protein